MQQLNFNIHIPTKKEKVWKAIWSEKNYRTWCSIFEEGSHYKIDEWKLGSTIQFLSSSKNGIYSKIIRYAREQLIEFEHLGTVLAGEPQAINDESKAWSGARERYNLTEEGSCCILAIKIDVMSEHVDFMRSKFPLALERIKQISLGQ